MNQKFHIYFYILIILLLNFNQISSNSLTFKFHITSNPYPPKYNSNYKSFLELDKSSDISTQKQRMSLEFCFGPPKACHLLTIHSQSFLI